MTDISFLQAQAAGLSRLLSESEDDPILAPQLRERLEDAQAELDRLKTTRGVLLLPPPLPRAAFFLIGGPDVSGSDGVQPRLAGEALIQYEAMFVGQAIHDERQAARATGRQRRMRNAPAPALLLTGTPRGSFGFEFIPKLSTDGTNGELHAQALKHVAEWVDRVVSGDLGELADVFGRVPPGVRPSLRGFLRVLADHGTGLRLAFSDAPARRLSGDQVRAAADRLQRDVTLDDNVPMRGILTGVLPENAEFEFRPDDGTTFKGDISDATDEDVRQMRALQDRRCEAHFQRTTVKVAGRPNASSYVLLGVPALIEPSRDSPPAANTETAVASAPSE